MESHKQDVASGVAFFYEYSTVYSCGYAINRRGFLHLRLVYYLGLRKQLKEAARLSGRLLCAELARRGSESLKVYG